MIHSFICCWNKQKRAKHTIFDSLFVLFFAENIWGSFFRRNDFNTLKGRLAGVVLDVERVLGEFSLDGGEGFSWKILQQRSV
jgi:hypothetical protein